MVRAAAPGHKHKTRTVRGASDSVNEGGTGVAVDSVSVFWRTLTTGSCRPHHSVVVTDEVVPL